jgi:hypothetical protein
LGRVLRLRRRESKEAAAGAGRLFGRRRPELAAGRQPGGWVEEGDLGGEACGVGRR